MFWGDLLAPTAGLDRGRGVCLHADMAIKRKALDRTRQPDTQPGDYQPVDPLLAWLQSL